MKYTLTFTTDVNDNAWGTTDTIIFTTPHTADEGVAGLLKEDLTEMVENILMDYGLGGTTAEIIATSGWYYIRNCDDVDVEVK